MASMASHVRLRFGVVTEAANLILVLLAVQGPEDRCAEIPLGNAWMQQGLTATSKDCGSERTHSEIEISV
jgi:hypothetical protein